MGTVFLADTPDGTQVAVKVIRGEHAADPDFRRRFRAEVAHAQKVPPFCTAEVLDADPDYETPYLVVEYVEGPTLTQVVATRGPLSPATVYGVAVTVASALTAIHGAGVIHRDLKPSNVLLAPGAPKVIDFGIASATSSATVTTGGQPLVGTVAYMSPERLEATAGDRPTAAADIFAWGAVVAYAANGRPPFLSDSPTSTAVAILTREPDLGNLTEPLRSQVARALAKNPDDRPSARDLYDELVSTERRPAGVPVPAGGAPTVVIAPAGPTEIVRPAGSRWPWPRRAGLAALALLLVAAAGVLVGLLTTGTIRMPGSAAPRATPVAVTNPPTGAATSSPSAPASPSPSLSPSGPAAPAPLPFVFLRDPLTKAVPGHWRARPDNGAGYNASCSFTGDGLQAQLSSIGLTRTWRCDSPSALLGDVQVSVSVTLDTPDACAAVWFRFQGKVAGYAMRICADHVEVGTHSGPTLTVLQQADLSPALALGVPARFSVMVVGHTLTMLRCTPAASGCTDPQLLGQADNSTFTKAGTVQLGLFEPDDAPADQPYRVTFADVEIRTTLPSPSSP
jgi:eukaryotic-like serine/threonine-protein kinase